jgi:hypothetical protein
MGGPLLLPPDTVNQGTNETPSTATSAIPLRSSLGSRFALFDFSDHDFLRKLNRRFFFNHGEAVGIRAGSIFRQVGQTVAVRISFGVV